MGVKYGWDHRIDVIQEFGKINSRISNKNRGKSEVMKNQKG